jgi:hypothetical protein
MKWEGVLIEFGVRRRFGCLLVASEDCLCFLVVVLRIYFEVGVVLRPYICGGHRGEWKDHDFMIFLT